MPFRSMKAVDCGACFSKSAPEHFLGPDKQVHSPMIETVWSLGHRDDSNSNSVLHDRNHSLRPNSDGTQ